MITLFALARLCFAPVSGPLVQRLGSGASSVSGLLIVAVSTAACAFAIPHWQPLLFRSLVASARRCSSSSALGLDPDQPARCPRGKVATYVLQRVSHRLWSPGRCWGSLTAGLGLNARRS